MLSRRNAALAALIVAGIVLPSHLACAQGSSDASTAALLPVADAPTGATTAAPLQMPVRGGSITLKVTDFSAARQKIMDAAVAARAEIMEGKTYVATNGRQHGYLRLRLTADRLTPLLTAVRGVGTLYSDNLFTTEQVSNYEELGRRIEQLQKHQGRLDALLSSSRRLRGSDILYVQERLFRAGVDQSLLEQQRLDQERESRSATITVTLFEPLSLTPNPAYRAPTTDGPINLVHGFVNARKRAAFHLNRLLATALTAAAFVIVYAPLWLPVFLGALVLLRILWVRRMLLIRPLLALWTRGTVLAHLLAAPMLRRLQVTTPATTPPETTGGAI